MVKLKFRLRLKRLTRPKSRTQYDFKQSEQNDQYRLSNKFELLAELGDDESENDLQGIGTDTEQAWRRLKVSMLDSARETLSVKRTQPKQAWITPETLALIEEKRSCSRDSDQYKRLKKQVRSSLRRGKRNHLESVCEEMEEYQKRND